MGVAIDGISSVASFDSSPDGDGSGWGGL